MNGRARARFVGLALLPAVVAVAGCGVPDQAHPTQLGDNAVSVVVPASSTSIPTALQTRHVELCLVSGDHLVKITTALPVPLSVRRTLQALVDRAADGAAGRNPVGHR